MALKVVKPNIRKMFVPDPGNYLVEIDIKQGDAQVVAWEAQDEKLMDLFEKQTKGELIDGKKIDIHSQNCLDVFSDAKLNEKGKAPDFLRQITKKSVHATNYAGSAYEIAKRVGVKINQIQTFQTRWFAAHPAIPKWHQRISFELMETRRVTNIFGYHRIYFDRIDEILPEALAWCPQSTVALVINAGIRKVRKTLPFVRPMLQVHDSALYQIPIPLFTESLRQELTNCHLITLPYPRPLTMGVDIKWSATSWGETTDEDAR